MIPAQDTKYIMMTPPVALVSDASLLTTEIDCKGWDYLQIVMSLGVCDGIFTALAVTESDSTGANHANVTGLVFATSTNIDGDTSAFPTASADNTIYAFDIDLRGRKRFIDLTATIDATSSGDFATVLAILSRAEQSPTLATSRGCAEVLRV